mmetsp:Transcript_38744/g.82300  ORF Transcript_38744/g.82300 Transcript_38744/m.82300 type:complete len:426 (-) Transcript_38744:41-1318(-)
MAVAGEQMVTLLLAGPSGAGKSETGNTLSGRNDFVAADSASSVTQRCQAAGFFLAGDGFTRKPGQLVDTPGFGDSDADPKQQLALFEQFKDLLPGGVSGMLFVVPFGRFGAPIQRSMDLFFDLLGDEAAKDVAILVVTHCGDNPQEKEAVVRASTALARYLPFFRGGLACIDNKVCAATAQNELFQRIQKLLQCTQGRKWECRHLREAQEYRASMQQRIARLPIDLQPPANTQLAALHRGDATREQVFRAVTYQEAMQRHRLEEERCRQEREAEAQHQAELARAAERHRRELVRQQQEAEKRRQQELEQQRRLQQEQQRLQQARELERQKEQQRLEQARELERQREKSRREAASLERRRARLEEERRETEARRREASRQRRRNESIATGVSAGAGIGSTLGLIGGPVGAIAGSAIGGFFGGLLGS